MTVESDRITRQDALALAAAAEAVKREVEGRFVTRRAFAAAMALIAVVVIVLGVVVGLTIEQLQAAEDQTDILTECTTPDPDPTDEDAHECFEDGQARSAVFARRLLEGFSDEVTRQIDRVLRSLDIEPVP